MAAPLNDNFADALLLTGNSGSASPITIDEATVETGEPDNPSTGSSNQSIWFKWIPSSSLRASIDTLGSVDTSLPDQLDTMLSVWTGTMLSDLVNVASNDDAGGGAFTSLVAFNAIAGTTYWIKAEAFNTSAVGYIKLNYKLLIPPPLSLQIAEAIDVPYKEYNGGLIAVRAYDFVAPLRTGLSVIDDADSRVGRVVREAQKVVPVEFSGVPGDIDQQATFGIAQDTIVIPFSAIPITQFHQYVIYVRYKATGGPDTSVVYGMGVLSYGFETFIGLRMNEGTDKGSVSTPFISVKKLPFWALLALANNVGADVAHSLHLRAITSTTNNVVYEIDQIFFVPSGGTPFNAVEGAGQSMTYFSDVAGGLPPVEDDDTFAGGMWSTQASALWGRTGFTGTESADYQQNSSYLDAEYSDVDIGNQEEWDDQSDMYIMGVGPSWVPSVQIVEDTFQRTVNGGWGNIESWNWEVDTTFTGIFTVTPGVGNISGSGSVNAIRIVCFVGNTTFTRQPGQTPDQYHSKVIDFDVSNSCKIEADISCDTPSAESKMCLLGYGNSRAGVGGNDKFFVGLVIVKQSNGSEAAVLAEFSSNPNISPNWVELCPRVPLVAGIHNSVTVERKSQYIEANIDGHKLTAHIAAQKWGGASPYALRAWEFFPYGSFPDQPGSPYQFYGIDPRGAGTTPCFGDSSSSSTTKSRCFRFKLTVEGYSSIPPTSSFFSIEPQDGHVPEKTIELPWGAMHVVVASNNYYGDINFDFDKNWRTKWWLPVGSPDVALAVVNHYWFHQEISPPPFTAQSIFWFYKDGAWHNAAVDSEYDLHYFKDGAWHRTSEGLQGRLSETWQQ